MVGVAPEDFDVANRYLAAVEGRPLIAFRMGGGVLLEFGEEPYYELLIEGRVRVALPDEMERYGDPVTVEVAAALVPLLNMDATTVILSPGGVLTVGVGDARLVVEPDQMYEAWQLRADNGLLLAGIPGGGIAIWPPDTAI